MPNFSFPRLSQHLNGLALGLCATGLCITGHLFSGGAAQARPATAPSQDLAMEEAATPAIAISPRQRALIEELLTLTNQEELFNQTMAITMDQVSQNMPTLMESMMGESPDTETVAEVQATMERVMGKILTGFQARISFQEIAEDVYYPLYAKNFSEAQLQDMIDFYNTPTGQHTIAVMPALVQDSMTLTQQRIMPTMIEVLQEVMTEETQFFSQSDQAVKARQSEGQIYIGSLNRAQQAYFLEYEEFSDSPEALGVGISSATDNYTYQVSVQQVQQPIAVNLATPAQDNLKAYVGLVFVTPSGNGYLTSSSVLCETPFPVSTNKPMPSPHPTGFMECPTGFVAVN